MTQWIRWWQHIPSQLDPVIFQIGSFRLQYYGLMYLVAFATTYLLVRHRLKSEKPLADIPLEHVQGLMTYMIVGLIVGARLGYVVFYNLDYYLAHPLEIVLPFDTANGFRFTGIAGMSYHGGLICTAAAGWWYIRTNRLRFARMADLMVPAIPAGYTFGRIGNFINGELWGRPTTLPIGMYFPADPSGLLRHPSQLYEAFFEGIVLFCLLWPLRRRWTGKGLMLPLYLVGYGTIRFVIEFFRQPDPHLGLVWLGLSMGQLLCGAMILVGAFMIAAIWAKHRQAADR